MNRVMKALSSSRISAASLRIAWLQVRYHGPSYHARVQTASGLLDTDGQLAALATRYDDI